MTALPAPAITSTVSGKQDAKAATTVSAASGMRRAKVNCVASATPPAGPVHETPKPASGRAVSVTRVPATYLPEGQLSEFAGLAVTTPPSPAVASSSAWQDSCGTTLFDDALTKPGPAVLVS